MLMGWGSKEPRCCSGRDAPRVYYHALEAWKRFLVVLLYSCISTLYCQVKNHYLSLYSNVCKDGALPMKRIGKARLTREGA